jgi:TP901 family phage tail tape measure protein
MDVARLGIRVDSGDAVTGKRHLDNLTNSGQRLEGRVSSLVRSVGALGAAFGAAFSLTSSIAQARALDAAVGELSTLIPGATRDLVAMTQASQAFGASFGTGTRAQAQAFYAAVSAGATDSAEAIARVDAANRLAVGGAAELTGSIAILNAATNAYADENLTAADASDILFTGVRTGVTTINELSAGLGQVIPIASALGIGLDELVGATAALTTQGQSTSLAVTGIRAALNATLQPSQQAAELAERLGISFNSAAVESMGFLGFMDHVAERTGGNRDALTTLFGSVEAGTAVLSLAGQGGVRFAQIMDEMADRAGAADEAYDQMAQRLSTRWNVIVSTAAERAESFGLVMLSGLVPAAEEVIRVLTGAEDASFALDVAMKAAAVTAGILMVQSVGSAAAAMISASAATGIWWTSLQLLTVQGGAAIVMSQALGAAVRFALGPVGLMITAVGLLTAAWVSHRTPVQQVEARYADLFARLQDVEGIQDRMRGASLQQSRVLLAEAEATQAAADAEAARAIALERSNVARAQAMFNSSTVDGRGSTNRATAARELAAAQERLAVLDDQQFQRRADLAGATEDLRRQVALLLVEERNRDRERRRAREQSEAIAVVMAEEADETDNAIRKVQGLTAAQEQAKWIYEQIHAPAEQYRNTLLAINQLLDEGQITQSQFNMRMREAQSAMLQASVDSGQASWIDGILAGLDKVAIRSQNVAFAMRDAFGQAAQSISQGLGDAVGRSIVFAEDLGGALMNVARNAVAQLISSFVQLGVQWLVNQAIGQSIASAATAASVGQATMVAAAWAPAAAAVSLASFGANSVPAMAGMAAAFAMSQGMAALGGLPGLNTGGSIMVGGRGGIDNNLLSINGSPVARVGQGERIDVIPRSAANDRGANDRGITVHIGTINAGSDVSREEVYAAVREGTEQAVVQSTRISAKDTNAKIERLARPQISARGY